MSLYEDKRGKNKRKTFDGLQWECTYCTYKNNSESFSCEMCSSRKGTSTRKPRLSTAQMEQLKTPNTQMTFSPVTSPDSEQNSESDSDSEMSLCSAKRFSSCVGAADEVTSPRLQRRCRSTLRNTTTTDSTAKSPVVDANKSSDEDVGADSSRDTSPAEPTTASLPKRRRVCRTTTTAATRKASTTQAAASTPASGRNTRNSSATPLNHRGDHTSSVSERLSSATPEKTRYKRGRPFKNKPQVLATAVNQNKDTNCTASAKNNNNNDVNESRTTSKNKSQTPKQINKNVKEEDINSTDNENNCIDSNEETNGKDVNEAEPVKQEVKDGEDLKLNLKKEEQIDEEEPCSRIIEDGESKSNCSSSTDSKDSQSADSNCSFNIKDAVTCFERGISRNIEITVNSVTVIIKEFEPLQSQTDYVQPVAS